MRFRIPAVSLMAAVASAQPVGVSLTITSPKADYFFGEVIPLELSFTSTQPRSFEADTRLQDRAGRMNGIEEFLVEPASLAEDPLRGLFAGQGGMGGLSSGPVMLSEKPFTVERVLNEWIRFRRPGEYRVHVVSRRVSEAGGQPGKRIELVSNVVTLTIRPAPAAWVSEQIAGAKAQVLRFLESPEAAEELVRRLTEDQDIDSNSAYLGVLSSPYRKLALAVMEQRLVAPGQPVWERYLDTLGQLAELAASGESMPDYPKEAAAQKAWQEESQRRAEVQTQKKNQYAARLIAALPAKQPQARAVSLNTLLNLGMRNGPEPPWLAGVAASLVAEFRALPASTQGMLLESRWRVLKRPAMLPLLREMVGNPSLQSVAVRRLFDLAPDEARKLVLDEIREPTKNLPFATLAALPDASLPELNDVLAERDDPLLILRYATGDILKRVEERYTAHQAEMAKQNLPVCAGPLAFYFLKYDAPFGERLLRADFAKDGLPPACYDVGFQFYQLGRWAYSPALERLAIESLTSPKVPVKLGAAEALGKYGSPAAQKPLWETMEYFRSWWKGREAELKEKGGGESMRLEVALRKALAQADGWVLQEPELRRLLALCSSEWCRTDVTGWANTARLPVRVGILPQGDGFGYTVAQYGPGSEEWLQRKVRQYPAGTVFQVRSWAAEDRIPGLREARERAEAAVR